MIPGFRTLKEFAKFVGRPYTCVQRDMKRGYCHWPRAYVDGRGKHPLYTTWAGMKQRCLDPNSSAYTNYGGRGIKVCPEWKLDFWSFVKDMGSKPYPTLTLDRIDNNKDYTKSNCRWVDRRTQNLNKRNVKPVPNVRFQKNKYCCYLIVCGKQLCGTFQVDMEQAEAELAELKLLYKEYL